MTITNTAKLGLPVDTNGEGPISTQPLVWNRVDTAAGVMTTTKGVNIPNTDLYDGAIVAEKDTGISWRCKSDGSGGFTKTYINYPWWVSKFWNSGVASNNVNANTGFSTFNAGVNADDSSVTVPTLNGIKVPIKALYSVTLVGKWSANTSGIRRTSIFLNNSSVINTYEQIDLGNNQAVGQVTRWQGVLNPGDYIMGQYYQNSGGNLNYYTSCWMTLLRPVP